MLGVDGTFLFKSFNLTRLISRKLKLHRVCSIRSSVMMRDVKLYKNREADVDALFSIVSSKTVDFRVSVVSPVMDVPTEKGVAAPTEPAVPTASFDGTENSAAVKLAGLIWLSTLYRASNFFSVADLEALGSSLLNLSPAYAKELTKGQPPGSAVLLLCKWLRITNLSSETIPSQLPIFPLSSAQGLWDSFICSSLGKLLSVAYASTLEVAKVNLSFLELYTSSLHADISQVSSDICWLLDNSKISPRGVLDPAAMELLAESLPALASLNTTALASFTSCRIELKSSLQLQGSRSPFRSKHVDIRLAPRAALIFSSLATTRQSLDRISTILLPLCFSRVPQIVSEWPVNVPQPNDIRTPLRCVPVSPYALEEARTKMLRSMMESMEQKVEWNSIASVGSVLEQVVGILHTSATIELRLASLLMEDDTVGCYNSAVEKAKKKKKNLSAKLNIGQPLQTFFSNFSTLTPISDQIGNKFPLLEMTDLLTTVLTPQNQGSRRPKVAKGAIDTSAPRMIVREQIFKVLREIFGRYGAVAIDTPIFERRETLMGKYGEDQKLIYDLKDQGGEQLSLRYDLTVPFARFLATQNLEKIKRLHIGKVYRRDEPQMNRGRFREFVQCDFDIAGDYDLMVPDCEVLSALAEVLKSLEGCIGPAIIKLNHRGLLDAIMDHCGVPAKSFRPICSAIDKLDKLSWDEVQEEMCTAKGLAPECANKIRGFVELHGKPFELLEKLESMPELTNIPQGKKTLFELRILFEYLHCSDAYKMISFDLSLARGLEYYTGVIFEAVLVGENVVGSIGAGGRYDKLVGMFSPKDIPAVGASIGVERVFRIIEKNLGLAEIKDSEDAQIDSSNMSIADHLLDVFVCSIGENTLKICQSLRHHGIAADFAYTKNMKIGKQLTQATDRGMLDAYSTRNYSYLNQKIVRSCSKLYPVSASSTCKAIEEKLLISGVPLAIVFGVDEMDKGVVKIKKLFYGEQDKDELENCKDAESEVEVLMDNIVAEVNRLLSKCTSRQEKTTKLILNSHGLRNSC